MIDVSVILFYQIDRGWLQQAIDSFHAQQFNGTSELVIVQSNRSVAENFNEGLRRANGTFIKMLADDDYMEPNCLQDLYDVAVTGHDLVCASAYNFNESDKLRFITTSTIPHTVAELADQNTIHGGTTLYNRESLLKLNGMREDLEFAEEYDLHMRMAAAGMRFGWADSVVYTYRVHDHQKSMQGGFRDGDAYLQRKRYILHTVQAPFMGNRAVIRR